PGFRTPARHRSDHAGDTGSVQHRHRERAERAGDHRGVREGRGHEHRATHRGATARGSTPPRGESHEAEVAAGLATQLPIHRGYDSDRVAVAPEEPRGLPGHIAMT